MSKMFDSQVKHYKNKFHNTVDNVSYQSIKAFASSNGIGEDFLKCGFLENTENFRKFVYSYAKTLMPGHVSCTTYAAVVAVIAKQFGVEYKAMSGFCLQMSHPQYEAHKADFDVRKVNDEHPALATHVYLVIGDVIYEYYNGDTSNIDHIDCVEI